MTMQGRDGMGDVPYTGSLGVTRFEPVFLPGPDGTARRVEIVRSVNATTDPVLAEAAREGTLHRIDGVDLAVPYVYHDPATRCFALVIPPARAHEELTLRAELLTRLAADLGAPLPSYVREARTVIGPEGLRKYLAERSQEREQFAVRWSELIAREEALAQEERALLANKNALQARERRLATWEEALEARERMLQAREAEIEAREAQYLAEAAARETQPHEFEAEPIEAEPIESTDPVAEIEHAEPADEPTEIAEPFAYSQTPTDNADDTANAIEAEEIEQIHEDEINAPMASVPPTRLARGQQAYAAVVDGEVRLWIRGRAEDASRLTQGSASLLLQADPDSSLPLALLTVTLSGTNEYLARTVLDLTRPDDRAVLETLARDFRVRLEVVSRTGRALGSYAVAAPGEANAQRVLAVLSSRPAGSEESRRSESERLIQHGIHSSEGETFDRDFEDESLLATAAGTERAVQAYLPLTDSHTLDRLVLAAGVPAARVDAIGKRVILAALRCGVEIPPALVRRAIELGIAGDEQALVTLALTAFARTCESALDSIGRSRSQASRAWKPLLAWAKQVGVEIPETARTAIAALFDPDDPDSVEPPDDRPAPATDSLTELSDEELSAWADHPRAREAVAREMARRDPVRFAAPLSRALRLLDPVSSAEIAVPMIMAGDALGDVWVELISSARPGVPALGAVGAALVRLRRGLHPVIQRALFWDDPDWRVFAWAAGEFGTAAVRALGHMDAMDIDRAAWVLAHVVRTGGGREVERARTGSNTTLAEAATRAEGRVDEARAFDAVLRQGPGQSPGEQRVHAVLARLDRDKHHGTRSGTLAP